MAVNHQQFGTFCEICFKQLTNETAATDQNGQKWDLCKGTCARQAGIVETPLTPLDHAIIAVINAYDRTADKPKEPGDIAARFTTLYKAIDRLRTEHEGHHP